jgi:digeranylgeranylglycerophospholipid reductase
MIGVAIVGGGPGGSYCAYSLAKGGVHPVIFDHSHPREKPCGGLVLPNAQELFPFLQNPSIEHSERKSMYLVSPSGRQVTLSNRRKKIRCFSRLKLDQFLLNMALSKGAELIKEKVTVVGRQGKLWKIETVRQSYVTGNLIGADGVNSLVRGSIIGSLSPKDKGLCYGYFVKGLERAAIAIRLLPRRKGCLWIMPRNDHTCVGIGTAEMSLSDGLSKELDLFIERNHPRVERLSKWAASIPNVKDFKTFNVPLAGSNWILIGDAAGHVSPMWGDGIMYALLDGELAAQALIEKDCRLFDRLWRETYGQVLSLSIKLRKWIYTRSGLELFCRLLKLLNILHL